MDNHPPSLGGSPTNPRMVTHQKEVYYRLKIWQLHFTHKTDTRHAMEGHIPFRGGKPVNHGMVTYQSKDGQPNLTLLGLGYVGLALLGPV